jgi:hypothetical protein
VITALLFMATSIISYLVGIVIGWNAAVKHCKRLYDAEHMRTLHRIVFDEETQQNG